MMDALYRKILLRNRRGDLVEMYLRAYGEPPLSGDTKADLVDAILAAMAKERERAAERGERSE